MEIKEFDTVLLKDGRTGSVVEVFPDGSLIVDVGSSSEDWETLYDKTVDDVEKVTILPLKGTQENLGALLMLTDETPYYMIDETLLQFVKEVIEQEMETCG